MQNDQTRLDSSFFRRREFMGLVATAGLSGGLECLGVACPTRGMTADVFQPYVGDYFHVDGTKDGTLDVKLVEAEAQPYDPERPPHVRREPFTLIFQSAEMQFEDQICRISHPRLGTVDAFLSRVDMPKQGANLQAVFG